MSVRTPFVSPCFLSILTHCSRSEIGLEFLDLDAHPTIFHVLHKISLAMIVGKLKLESSAHTWLFHRGRTHKPTC